MKEVIASLAAVLAVSAFIVAVQRDTARTQLAAARDSLYRQGYYVEVGDTLRPTYIRLVVKHHPACRDSACGDTGRNE